MTKQKNLAFWAVKTGQLTQYEYVVSDADSEDDANALAALAPKSTKVRELETVESSVSPLDSKYDPKEVISSKRWCVIATTPVGSHT